MCLAPELKSRWGTICTPVEMIAADGIKKIVRTLADSENIRIFARRKRKKGTIMEATTTRRRRTATPFTKAWNQAKKLDNDEKLELVAMLIESVRPAVTAPRKPRLYDPETGEYLNDETMQAIEDVRSGKDQGTIYESFEEFKKAMEAL